MFLNMTGETCTGTGNTLTLTGALDGHNSFGKTGNAEDGAVYSCVVADADGVTKVAGAYTFDKTANTFTRNDSWNSTASAVDKNPSSNIALSAGTHTIKCDTVARCISNSANDNVMLGNPTKTWIGNPYTSGADWLSSSASPSKADFIRGTWSNVKNSIEIDSAEVRVRTLSADALAKYVFGLYVIREGATTAELIAQSNEQDGSSGTGLTGHKTVDFTPIRLGVNDIWAVCVLSNVNDILFSGTTNAPSTQGFGVDQTWSSGEYSSETDIAENYSATMPASIAMGVAFPVGDYRMITGLLRRKV